MSGLRSFVSRLLGRQSAYERAGDQELGDMEAGKAKSGGGGGGGGSSSGAPDKAPFWREHREEFLSLMPFLWPKEEPWLRVCLVASFVCLFSAKLFSVAVPIALKAVVDGVLSGRVPVGAVLTYGACRFASDSTKEARDVLFNYVSSYASRKISLRTFNHVQSLSLRFHLNRKTGAVLRAVSRGSAAYADLLRYLAFQILPIFFELFLVAAYLLAKYDWPYAVITVATIFVYVAFTVVVTEWRNKFRREQTLADDAFNQKAVDSLLNYETVRIFNAEEHISGVYDASLRDVQDASIASQKSLSLLNAGQNGVISAGVVAVMGLAARQVVRGSLTIGDLIIVNSFILQLYTPVSFLGTYWRMIKQAMVDVEAMFALLREGLDVKDEPGAPDLRLTAGAADVEFRNVRFQYEPKRGPILHDVSFRAAAGCKLAVVGSSGAGKSTLARLLFRFYDCDAGAVFIAGQDIARCTQRSVRTAVGIVPQDTVLWNDTLMYNIAFGALGRGALGDEADVVRAAEAAQLTDFVARQPSRFNTQVGERGLRLSGGEKQRVAIARAFLKNPPVLILDEATSALDTTTEREVLNSLESAARGRTCLAIAHRLSTVMDADCIVVLHEGRVAELGPHAALLATGGLYAALWQRQLDSVGPGSAPAAGVAAPAAAPAAAAPAAASPAAAPALIQLL